MFSWQSVHSFSFNCIFNNLILTVKLLENSCSKPVSENILSTPEFQFLLDELLSHKKILF